MGFRVYRFWDCRIGMVEKNMEIMWILQGLYRDNGKENANYGLYRVYVVFI